MYTLQYNGMNLDFNGYRISAPDLGPVLWVDLPDEYAIQGNITESLKVNLTGMPASSSLKYFTMVFDAKLWGSTGGQARIIIENVNHVTPEVWSSSDAWLMRDHFAIPTYGPNFLTTEQLRYFTWTTDPDATQYVKINSTYGISTTLWPENTYKPFKIVCDRINGTCYLYIDNIFLGTVSGFTNDLLEWNMIHLFSDQRRNYEIAGVKNIKIAGFQQLADARQWSGV